MTTGSKVIDGRQTIAYPGGFNCTYGPYRSVNWNGGDGITPVAPRSAAPWYSRPKGKKQPKQRRTRQYIPPQNYSKTVVDQLYTHAPARWAGNSYDSYVQATITYPSSIGAYFYDVKQEYKLLAKLREEMYGSGFNPAVFIAEGRQALGMISNAAIRIGSAIGRLRARDPHGVLEALGLEPNDRFSRGLRDRTKALSSSWLEVNYGWLPLLNDAEDGAKWLAEAMNGEKRLPGALRKRKTWFAEESSPTPLTTYETMFTRRVDVFSLQYLIYGVSARNTFSPSLATVASVAWEKLPYSFVADWFVPIGSYIEACRTSSDITGTVVRSLKIDSIFLDYKVGPGITKKGSWFGGKDPMYRRMEFSRSVSTEIKVPHPLAYLLDDGLLEYKSWRHATNAVALLTQRNWSSLGAMLKTPRGGHAYTE